MQSRIKTVFKAGGLLTCLVVGVVCAMMIVTNISSPIIETQVPQKSWHLIPLAGEANPGAGKGGILEIFFINYTAGTVPWVNASATMEGWAATIGWNGWNNTDNFRQRVNLSTFYIVVKVRGNATQCKRGAAFYDSDLRVRWTCADLSIGADTVMERVVKFNQSGSPFMYINFYDDNSNAGFVLDKANTWPDNPVDITSIKLEAFY